MRIWIELANSPHINMFLPLIRELERGHELIITCRPLANTVALLDLHRIPYTVVGVHYGGRLSAKLLGFPVRVMQLRRFLAKRDIDVAISQSSFPAPVAARLLGVRSIYLNDNEHALGNVPAFACASTIMVPEFLRMEKLKRQWAAPRKVVHYPGVKEGMYLWPLAARIASRRANRTQTGSRKTAYIRPEPWLAQYYRGRREFLDELVLGMKDHIDIVLLPRDGEQAKHYAQPRFSGMRVATSALDIEAIAPECDLFIGAGGTMTREMAVLGVPSISVYQDELLAVDRYLIEAGAMMHKPDLTAPDALRFLKSALRRAPNRELLEKGRAAYEMVKGAVLKS